MIYSKKGIDWTKKDIYEGIGRPDLRPETREEMEESDDDIDEIKEYKPTPSDRFLSKIAIAIFIFSAFIQ